MEEKVWLVTDNVTEMLQNVDNNTSPETTATLPTTLSIEIQLQSLSAKVITTLGLIINIIGSLANSMVLTVLTLARQEYGSSVNTLIINQSAIDLFTCLSVFAIIVVSLADGFVYRDNPIIDHILCGTFSSFGVTVGKLGLVVITLERYFKIVHAVAHRKHYRNWMTKVGLALPWIGGACLTLIPALGTTKLVDGECLRTRVWPTEGMLKVKL